MQVLLIKVDPQISVNRGCLTRTSGWLVVSPSPTARLIAPSAHEPMECDLHTSIPDWLIEHPETAPAFTELGLDVSCGGKSLEYVAIQQGLDPRAVLRELRRRVGPITPDAPTNP